MYFLAVVILAFLTACGQADDPWVPPPYDVYPKADQDSGFIRDMEKATKNWNDKLRPTLGYDVFVFHAEGEPDPEACGTIVIGFGDFVNKNATATADLRDPCHISLNFNPNGFWGTTIEHELGHVLGLRDIPTEKASETIVNSIMTQGTIFREVTPADVAAVLARIGV